MPSISISKIMNYLDEIITEMAERDVLRGVVGESHKSIHPTGDYKPWHHDDPLRIDAGNTMNEKNLRELLKKSASDSMKAKLPQILHSTVQQLKSTMTLDDMIQIVRRAYSE